MAALSRAHALNSRDQSQLILNDVAELMFRNMFIAEAVKIQFEFSRIGVNLA